MENKSRSMRGLGKVVLFLGGLAVGVLLMLLVTQVAPPKAFPSTVKLDHALNVGTMVKGGAMAGESITATSLVDRFVNETGDDPVVMDAVLVYDTTAAQYRVYMYLGDVDVPWLVYSPYMAVQP